MGWPATATVSSSRRASSRQPRARAPITSSSRTGPPVRLAPTPSAAPSRTCRASSSMKKGFPRDSRAIERAEAPAGVGWASRSAPASSSASLLRKLADHELADLELRRAGRAAAREASSRADCRSRASTRKHPTSSSGRRVGRAQQLREQRRAVRVPPLQVVDEENERRGVRDPAEELPERAKAPAALLERVRDRDDPPPRERHGLHLPQHREEAHEGEQVAGQQRLGLGLRQSSQVVGQRVHEAVEGLVRHRFLLVRAPRQNDGARVRRRTLVQESPHQRGLADAGAAANEHGDRAAFLRRERRRRRAPRAVPAGPRMGAAQGRQRRARAGVASVPPTPALRRVRRRISSADGRSRGSRRRSSRQSASRSSGASGHDSRGAGGSARCFSTRTSRNSPGNGRVPVRAS